MGPSRPWVPVGWDPYGVADLAKLGPCMEPGPRGGSRFSQPPTPASQVGLPGCGWVADHALICRDLQPGNPQTTKTSDPRAELLIRGSSVRSRDGSPKISDAFSALRYYDAHARATHGATKSAPVLFVVFSSVGPTSDAAGKQIDGAPNSAYRTLGMATVAIADCGSCGSRAERCLRS